jgi:hypothetical protein
LAEITFDGIPVINAIDRVRQLLAPKKSPTDITIGYCAHQLIVLYNQRDLQCSTVNNFYDILDASIGTNRYFFGASHVVAPMNRKSDVHPETMDGYSVVFHMGASRFSLWQGNRRIARQRTHTCTPHQQASGLIPPRRKRTVSG